MWLADAVAAYVERLNERDFDAPFIALLHHLGYTQVHKTHGPYEFGKDFVARRHEGDVEHQWCFQTKAGNINSKQLRTEVLPQVELMRSGPLVHPSFDKNLPRRIVVVTTGRLVGSAGAELQQTEDYRRERGEVAAELWDIDTLVPDLVASLVTDNDISTQARLLELAGRFQNSRGTRADVASVARSWLGPGESDKQNWRDVLTACLLADAAAKNGREDLAQQAVWQLVRAYYRAVERGDHPSPEVLDVAHLAFTTLATDFFEQISAVDDPIDLTLESVSAPAAFLTHPIKMARLCETVSMLALSRLDAGDTTGADQVIDFLETQVHASPALARLVGEEWAYSILVTVTALVAGGRLEAATTLARTAMVWTSDLLEDGVLLPSVGATAIEVADRVLAANFKPPAALGTKDGYTFAVLADLASLLGDRGANPSTTVDAPSEDAVEKGDLYGDFVHDLDALRAMATLTVPTGVDTGKHIARVEYFPNVPHANHYKPEASDGWPVASWFDSLQIWGTVRDRHLPAVLADAVAAGSPSYATGPNAS